MNGNGSHLEAMERISKVADIAGVQKRKGIVQSLHYSNEWMQDEYKVIELPADLLGVLKEGDRVVIRGDHDDDVILCSQDKSYDLKAADTTNVQLVVPGLVLPSKDLPAEKTFFERSVLTCFTSYLEVKPIRPRLERLKNLLEENAFSNRDNQDEENGITIEKFTTSALLDIVQASKEELLTALNTFSALEINGFWRILEITYQEKAFAQILSLIEEQSWDWRGFLVKDCCDILEELYPRFVLRHCMSLYGEITSETPGDDSSLEICSLSEDAVCKFYAEYILRPAGKFNFVEFMEAWKQSVPEDMTCKPEHLWGLALKDEKSHPPVIWHFTERHLPEDPSERFNVLFRERTKWRHEDIEPYLRNVLAPGQALNALF